MTRWFRLYDEMLDDPKVQKLAPAVFKAWVNILCLASRNNGRLPSLDDMAFSLRLPPESVVEILSTLSSAGLIDDGPDGLSPHNWGARQFKSDGSTERVKAFRERSLKQARNVAETATVTPPDTDTEAETESISNASHSHPDAAAPVGGGGFSAKAFEEEFWPAYPEKVGKAEAAKVFAKIRRSGKTPLEVIMGGLERYVRCKPADRKWCSPARWLSEGRWADEWPDAGGNLDAKDFAIALPDTEEWKAWHAYRQGNGQPTKFMESEARSGRGYTVPSRWPPSSTNSSRAA